MMAADARDVRDVPLPRLTRAQFWTFFALAIAIFVLGHGPVWRHPWEMSVVNDAILWSYLPLPVFVAAGLAYKKRLSLKAFFLDLLELTLLKYSVTFLFILALWARTSGPPPAAPLPPPQTMPLSPDVPAVPTPIPAGEEGGVVVRVVDGSGAPVRGALVYVATGLEKLVFAPREDEIVLENAGHGIVPNVAAVQLGEPLVARSTDGGLHNVVGRRDAVDVFNVPIIGAGTKSPLAPHDAGSIELRCSVHERLGIERPGRLIVLNHPFFGATSDDGTVRLANVPAVPIELEAAHDSSTARAKIAIERGHDVTTTIALR